MNRRFVLSAPACDDLDEILTYVLEQSGSRVTSPLARVGKKWVAACEHPQIAVSACKVEQLGSTRIVTGPTREAVSVKVEELMEFGGVIVRDVECAGDVWTAVCEMRES